MRDLSILVLAFDEAANLRGAVADIQAAAVMLDDYQIVIVNDGSTDGTAFIADALAAENSCIRAIHHDVNRGLRAGYETGLSQATLSRVVWLPADQEIAPSSIRAIFESVGRADLSVPYHGTPERRSWFRRLLTWGSTTEMNFLFGFDLRYYQGTLCLPTALARSITRTEPGFFCMAEQLLEALDSGCTYVEVPLIHQERQSGVSKAVSLGKIWAAQKAILRFWWRLRMLPALQALGFAWEYR